MTGSDRSPASTGEKPSTFWKKSVMSRNIEKIDADSVKPSIVAPVKAGLRNSERSSSGSAARCSATTNSTSSSAEAAKQPTMRALPQPSSLPRISA